ncbi:transcriptional regulator, IclR family [Pseudarthrobacter chlorophenolicus A6]|uniref:Transcriptional regulator, IclR family n=1 Tax=Pseudarthrobacter chlorophenolicus (strain ATCC 700700 / DSM 12829 / CIP 107037 / JCM 12360 / KCTC 9906 / NCIMB 13794 / A6) TaxID=452863 RepID=B8HBG3_PSECP|nr:IclR family transcriptional regulator [Pseudarthrobacter chlorophenolicus]ACL38648.1 transcriptional regulator, IclR family [Pseudarthrobacter chlorophenolicus A6]SDQ44617.1 DNA-binding transcriptional regulator, IclR family [Pseudarthrobacter chlorophenolicus]
MSNSPVQGAQVVSRLAGLLRLVGRSAGGMPLAGIVRESGLTRPTVHRLLSSMAAEGLLDHDPANGNWVLGPEMLLLGSVASARFPMEDIARPSLRRLAEATGESAFFSIRRGTETVCLLREEGSFPVRSFVLREGVRFPLGVASAGTAIMAFLPDGEREGILQDWEAHAGTFAAGHTAGIVRENLERTRLAGYSVNPGLVLEGSWGMGAAVFDRSGKPAWALSLTGIEPRFKPERQEELGGLLLAEAHRITQQLGGGEGALPR